MPIIKIILKRDPALSRNNSLNYGTKYECGTTIFTILHKEGTVIFISYYHRINTRIVRNPYPFRTIGNMMKILEGFQYAIMLYLSMVYFNIQLCPQSIYKTTIITKFIKFRYNQLVIGM